MLRARHVIICSTLLIVSSLQSLAQQPSDNAKCVLEKLTGTWVCENLVASGEPAPEELVRQLRWTFADSKTLIVQQTTGGERDRCRLSIDLSTSPISFQFTPPGAKLNPPVPNDSGPEPRLLGVLKFEDESLVVAIDRDYETPILPTEFESKKDSNTVLMRFKRAADK